MKTFEIVFKEKLQEEYERGVAVGFCKGVIMCTSLFFISFLLGFKNSLPLAGHGF